MILDADAVGRRAGMFAYWLCVVSKAHMVGTEGSLVRRREKEREEREREREREREKERYCLAIWSQGSHLGHIDNVIKIA